MSVSDRALERLRWRCWRGMLELDLVLKAFLERHLETLDEARLEAFAALLERTDPDLLDLVMGVADGRDPRERELLALMRDTSNHEQRSTQPV